MMSISDLYMVNTPDVHYCISSVPSVRPSCASNQSVPSVRPVPFCNNICDFPTMYKIINDAYYRIFV